MTDEQLEIYRQMTPSDRVRTGCALHDFAFDRLLLDLKRKHPDRPASELVKEVARRFLGEAAGVL